MADETSDSFTDDSDSSSDQKQYSGLIEESKLENSVEQSGTDDTDITTDEEEISNISDSELVVSSSSNETGSSNNSTPLGKKPSRKPANLKEVSINLDTYKTRNKNKSPNPSLTGDENAVDLKSSKSPFVANKVINNSVSFRDISRNKLDIQNSNSGIDIRTHQSTSRVSRPKIATSDYDSDNDLFWVKPRLKKNVIESDSSDGEEEKINIRNSGTEDHKKTPIIKSKHSTSTLSLCNNTGNEIESSDLVFIKPPWKKNVIELDSSDTDEDKTNIHASDIEEHHSACIEQCGSDEEVNNVSERLSISRLSEEFTFKNEGPMLNSTVLEKGSNYVTPISTAGKRLLNRSINTPRILKHMKESNTPRNVPDIISSRSPSPELKSIIAEDSSDDIIDVSSEDEVAAKTPSKFRQTTLDTLLIKKNEPNNQLIKQEPAAIQKEVKSPIVQVPRKAYKEQNDKVKQIQSDIQRATNLLRTVNMEHLPDKGKSIYLRHAALEKKLVDEVKALSKMEVTEEVTPPFKEPSDPKSKVEMLSWQEIEARAGKVQPKTFGKQAMSTYNAQKALTIDRLHQIHGSLESCPKESDYEMDPKGLKVELMPHQRRALAWLIWREKQKPSGGILADDMGLGKTLTMIALMMKSNEIEDDESEDSDDENNSERSSYKCNGGTLVVCPASLINQWSGELEARTKRGLVGFEMYHGPKRETKPKRLAKHDMVITTYSIVNNECEKRGAVFGVKWRRIVIDEAHQIRNHKSQTCVAVCSLSAKSRWALTGTPVHNKEMDMYALLKYLRCSPFDDVQVWKRWVGDKSTGGTERLHTIISSLMLRRTKVELIEKGFLNSMPERKWELIQVQLMKNELDVYNRILIFSRTLFSQFLHQRAEKNQEAVVANSGSNMPPNGPNQDYFIMRQKLLRLNKVRDIKQHEILVLLLRLRQICCHPSLITSMLHEGIETLGADEGLDGEHSGELDLLDQLNKLAIDDKYDHNTSNHVAEGLGEEAPGLKEAARGLLNHSNPVFSKERMSSKIQSLLVILREKILNSNDKAIIVSQWPSFLNLIGYHLKKEKIKYDQLDGTVPVNKRMEIVNSLNDPKSKMKVLLLSLTAGGIGLNLIGANHLFLLDLHWNPQLEKQAQDRIYRVGQSKAVFVYKFIATDTIEKRILDLQEKKLEIAQSMLTGTKQVIGSKLTLQDLKMLFEM